MSRKNHAVGFFVRGPPSGSRTSAGLRSLSVMPRAALVVLLAGAAASACRARDSDLPLYGYQAGSTANLDRLGREGVVFDAAYSHCPLTLPAHASMLTGLLPPRHGVRDNLGFRLSPDHPTLATRFKAAGMHTGGAISAYVLRAATGINQGFDFYDDGIEVHGGTESAGSLQRDGAVAVDALSKWVRDQRGARFFAFLHLYEPHTPYDPPERHRNHPLLYDGDISYADELVGRFLDSLKARGMYDRALIMLTSAFIAKPCTFR
ncbi:MAG: hypothetical protein DMF82_19230 [Acidobacteria bacterium]|nr:MAG: hypothetical protein DMF82_19230 [Acidobacteriota bacterium]